MSFQVSDFVKHKNVSERLRIKKIDNGIAVCDRIEEPMILGVQSNEYIYPVYICILGSLEPEDKIENGNQLTLFK